MHVWKSSCGFPVPSGESPLGTGQWPVLPAGLRTPQFVFARFTRNEIRLGTAVRFVGSQILLDKRKERISVQ